MLTVIDIVNRLLGYFNIADKPKGRAFTIVAFFANLYLLYIAIQNIRYPDFRLRGIFFLVVFLVLLYFIYLNLMYYFTQRPAPLDISPSVEKWLGSNGGQKQAVEQSLTSQLANTPANGIFQQEQLLTADLKQNAEQTANLEALVETLIKQGLISLNYQGLDDKAIARVATESQGPVPAMGAPIALPFFDVQREDQDLIIFGGLNALMAKPLATVDRVGLLSPAEAQDRYTLVLASVFLSGGEEKRLGREGVRVVAQPYRLNAQLAYQAKPDHSA